MDIKEQKNNAQTFLNNVKLELDQLKERIKQLENAEQQVTGRLQLLNELDDAESENGKVEVVAGEVIDQ